MASTQLIDREAPVVVTNTATVPQRASRLPRKLRFPILTALYFCLNTTLWSFAASFLRPELGAVSKLEDDGFFSLFAVLAFRIGSLYLTWRLNYDWIDVSAFTVLTSAPYAYLLVTYFNITTLTVAAFASIEVISVAFPTLLLRPRSKMHNASASLRNRFLLESFQVQTSTAVLAIGVYVVVLWGSIKTGFLNRYLVAHFDIPTVEGAYQETAISLIMKVASVGIAARTFLLNPSIGAQPASGTVTPVRAFDPVTATLPETFAHNFWFFSKRTRTLIKQTAVVSIFMLLNTIQRTSTLVGSDLVGAVGYSLVWILATVITAAWWFWVGNTEG